MHTTSSIDLQVEQIIIRPLDCSPYGEQVYFSSRNFTMVMSAGDAIDLATRMIAIANEITARKMQKETVAHG